MGIGWTFVQNVATFQGGAVVLDSSGLAGTTFSMDRPGNARALNLKREAGLLPWGVPNFMKAGGAGGP